MNRSRFPLCQICLFSCLLSQMSSPSTPPNPMMPITDPARFLLSTFIDSPGLWTHSRLIAAAKGLDIASGTLIAELSIPILRNCVEDWMMAISNSADFWSFESLIHGPARPPSATRLNLAFAEATTRARIHGFNPAHYFSPILANVWPSIFNAARRARSKFSSSSPVFKSLKPLSSSREIRSSSTPQTDSDLNDSSSVVTPLPGHASSFKTISKVARPSLKQAPRFPMTSDPSVPEINQPLSVPTPVREGMDRMTKAPAPVQLSQAVKQTVDPKNSKKAPGIPSTMIGGVPAGRSLSNHPVDKADEGRNPAQTSPHVPVLSNKSTKSNLTSRAQFAAKTKPLHMSPPEMPPSTRQAPSDFLPNPESVQVDDESLKILWLVLLVDSRDSEWLCPIPWNAPILQLLLPKSLAPKGSTRKIFPDLWTDDVAVDVIRRFLRAETDQRSTSKSATQTMCDFQDFPWSLSTLNTLLSFFGAFNFCAK